LPFLRTAVCRALPASQTWFSSRPVRLARRVAASVADASVVVESLELIESDMDGDDDEEDEDFVDDDALSELLPHAVAAIAIATLATASLRTGFFMEVTLRDEPAWSPASVWEVSW
jgi:hypothetical protein